MTFFFSFCGLDLSLVTYSPLSLYGRRDEEKIPVDACAYNNRIASMVDSSNVKHFSIVFNGNLSRDFNTFARRDDGRDNATRMDRRSGGDDAKCVSYSRRNRWYIIGGTEFSRRSKKS